MLEKLNRLLKIMDLPPLPDGTHVEQFCSEYMLTRGEAVAFVPRTGSGHRSAPTGDQQLITDHRKPHPTPPQKRGKYNTTRGSVRKTAGSENRPPIPTAVCARC